MNTPDKAARIDVRVYRSLWVPATIITQPTGPCALFDARTDEGATYCLYVEDRDVEWRWPVAESVRVDALATEYLGRELGIDARGIVWFHLHQFGLELLARVEAGKAVGT